MNGMRERWYHGGPPGLSAILPSAETGALSLASYGAHGVCRRDRVYLVNNRDFAWVYARFSSPHGGVVYEVEPVGELEPDTDFIDRGDGVRSVCCLHARIVGRHRAPGGRR